MITPQQCTVFVQVWVDVNALQQGSTQGCYAVSNRSQQSTGEGTANLTTNVVTGSKVCWAVLPIDPQYNGQFSITGVGAQSGWMNPPAPYSKQVPNVFTGQVEEATVGGTINSNIQFSFNGDNPITVTLPVTINPIQQ